MGYVSVQDHIQTTSIHPKGTTVPGICYPAYSGEKHIACLNVVREFLHQFAEKPRSDRVTHQAQVRILPACFAILSGPRIEMRPKPLHQINLCFELSGQVEWYVGAFEVGRVAYMRGGYDSVRRR